MRPARAALLAAGLLSTLCRSDTVLYKFGSGTAALSPFLVTYPDSSAQCAHHCARKTECYVWKYDTSKTGLINRCRLFGTGAYTISSAYSKPLPPPTGSITGPGNVAYLVVNTLMDRVAAETHCRSVDSRATLAVPDTLEIISFLMQESVSGTWDDNTMLGINCIGTEFANIATATTLPIQLSWFDPTSDTACGSDMCLVVQANGLYHDSCGHEHPFLCEIKL